MSISVQRLSAPGPVREWLERGDLPLVIEGGAREWPALVRWNRDYLARRLGAVTVQYKYSSSNAHPDFRKHTPAEMFARRQAPFHEYLRAISEGPVEQRARHLFTGDEQFVLRRREGRTEIDPALGVLLEDVIMPDWFAAERLYTVWSWFSGPGVRTWLHYDNNGCHNLNAQITGHKSCWLFSPDELPHMFPYPLGGNNPAYNCSAIDAERPQPEYQQAFLAARAHCAALHAGDLLFIPAWWFHTFAHHGELNSNVNFWWRPERGVWNAVAARQALVDAAEQAALERSDDEVKRVLSALDAAAQRRRWL